MVPFVRGQRAGLRYAVLRYARLRYAGLRYAGLRMLPAAHRTAMQRNLSHAAELTYIGAMVPRVLPVASGDRNGRGAAVFAIHFLLASTGTTRKREEIGGDRGRSGESGGVGRKKAFVAITAGKSDPGVTSSRWTERRDS
ncbi:unnamed protein product [Chrysodeixis includens]|uniref:Uncharacterized protein n=1 Tax=Chrysodeixis includens TaxID=689277 RepID=A0A9N8KY02_CHRIL|nr:unnamed protein product [Chrysodeixis includens]